MEMILNTIRLINNDQNVEWNCQDVEFMEEHLAIGFINPLDFKKLYLVPSLKLHISNNHGDVIVNFKQDSKIPEGIILMPVSLWANQVTYVKNNNIIYKNIKVNVEGTRDPPTKLNELIEKIKSDKI
ncbi:MAG: hypothetical protein JXA99_09640 [Candidatus Lokiarchaeota archaeon]|nr:hypothetical protein [Candidatus Lokiarchaeota archaeon]